MLTIREVIKSALADVYAKGHIDTYKAQQSPNPKELNAYMAQMTLPAQRLPLEDKAEAELNKYDESIKALNHPEKHWLDKVGATSLYTTVGYAPLPCIYNIYSAEWVKTIMSTNILYAWGVSITISVFFVVKSYFNQK